MGNVLGLLSHGGERTGPAGFEAALGIDARCPGF